MKKILLIILFISCLMLTGCGDVFRNNVEENENSITFTLGDDYLSFVDGDNIPSFIFSFNGNLNTVINRKSFYAQFSYNEDKILSDALNLLFNQYKDRTHIEQVSKTTGVTKTKFSTINQYGTLVNQEYTPDDYTVYHEKAFISLENGLKIKIEYRRFLYNGNTYYTWPTTQPLTITVVYAYMIIKQSDKLTNKLVLITLPTRIAPTVYNNVVADRSIGISNVINDSTYAYSNDSIYYTYDYLNESSSDDEEQKIKDNQQYIIDYYVNEWNGSYVEEENGKFIYYSYCDNDFKVELLNETFKMHYLPKN